MIRHIIRKEIREILRTSRMNWMLAGLLMLLALSVYNGYTYYKSHSELLKTSQEVTYQQFINQGNKNPHLGAHFGFYAYKPTADMAMLDNGVEDYTGNSFYLEPHKRGIIKFREVADATTLKSFGFFNIAYFIQFIFPLFIFLVCHNIFSKEWENGTIKMIMSSNVTRQEIFIGKLSACLIFIYAMVALLTIISLILVWCGDAPIKVTISKLVIYIAGLFVYATLITTIATTVSLLTKSSALSLIILSIFWIIGVFLVPRLSGELSKNIHPSISSIEFEHNIFNEMQYGVDGEGTKDYRREKLLERTLKEYQVDSIQQLPVYFIPITIEYFEESDGKIMDKYYDKVTLNQEAQDLFVRSLSLLSPFFAFRDFSMHITATDMNTHHDFSEKAEIHRRKVGVLVDNYYQRNTEAGNDFWKTIPQFSYQPPSTMQRLKAGLGAAGTLGCWILATIGLVIFSYRKMHV